jgi:predicted nucleotidyltransferase
MNDRALPPKAPEVGKLLAALVRHGVDFVVVGGQAGIALGSSYPSYDLDVMYARGHANAVRLVAALEEIGVTLRGTPADLPFQLDARTIENGANFTFTTPYGDLDVLADVGGVRSYEELRSQSEEREIAGLEVRIASLDHLIAMKRAANRTKDKLMLEEYIVIADERRAAAQRDEGSSS